MQKTLPVRCTNTNVKIPTLTLRWLDIPRYSNGPDQNPWQTLGIAWDQSQLQPVLVTITSSRALTRKVGHSVDSVGIRVDDLTLICVCHHCAPPSAAFLGFQR